jgi:hypothetical protein
MRPATWAVFAKMTHIKTTRQGLEEVGHTSQLDVMGNSSVVDQLLTSLTMDGTTINVSIPSTSSV